MPQRHLVSKSHRRINLPISGISMPHASADIVPVYPSNVAANESAGHPIILITNGLVANLVHREQNWR
jgi:hypothetical protein